MANNISEQSKTSVLDTAFRRLHEAHRHWHHAQTNYFDPEEFRMAMQSCIQTLRTVTFMLQAGKGKLPGFDEWYAQKQEAMRSDEILRWLITARNHIEKAGDLVTYSKMTAKVLASYHDNLEIAAVEGELFDSIGALFRKVPTCYLMGQVFEHGVLRIERRWVANTLSSHELLDAIAHAYTLLSQVLADACAHWSLMAWDAPRLHGEKVKEPLGECLSCMRERPEIIESCFSLKDGARIEVTKRTVTWNDADKPMIIERYGPFVSAATPPSNLLEHVRTIFDQARRVLKKDGHHVPIVFFFKENLLVHLLELHYENRASKYLLMREVAEVVRQIQADAVIHIGEAWTAKASQLGPFQYPVDVPSRGECLIVMGCTHSIGISIEAEITRSEENLNVGNSVESIGSQADMFAPVIKVWNELNANKDKLQ